MNEKPGRKFNQLGLARPPHLAAPGKGYSMFVRFLRLALPLLAVGIIGLLISWPRVEDTLEPIPSQAAAPQDISKNELVNPRFESADASNQPFTITARRALQSARDPSVVLLEHPMADITLNNGTWMAAEAARGAYRQDEDRLLLQGGVTLFHDKGYEVRTEKLLLNLSKREAWSDVAVSGQGPAGTLEASGMQAHAGNDRLIFTGPVRLTLNRSIDGLE